MRNKFSLLPNIFDEGNKIVNTVSSVAKLFLTKNFLVIYMILFSLIFLFEFPLTPRRVALINIFSIGLPSLIIALKNTNTEKTVNFIKDLFSFVIISALFVTVAAYIGQYIINRYSGQTSEDIQMVMLTIMIFITVANFLSVVIRKGEKNLKLYLLYAIGLIGLYSFFAVTQIDFVLIRLIKTFYEISYLQYRYWDTAIVISVIGAVVLYTVQKFRERIFQK